MFRQITAIGIQFDQKFNYLVENGDIYSIRIKYIPDNFEENDLNKIGWFYLTLDYNDIRICTDRKIVLTANLVDDASNILPYGIAIYSENKIEANRIDDFSLGIVEMIIISYDEVENLRNRFYV